MTHTNKSPDHPGRLISLPGSVLGLVVSGTVARTNKQQVQVNAVRPATRDLMDYIPD